MLLSNGDDPELVRVTRITQKYLRNVNGCDAVLDGFSDVIDLRTYLKRTDPTLKDDSYVTVVDFVRLDGELANDI